MPASSRASVAITNPNQIQVYSIEVNKLSCTCSESFSLAIASAGVGAFGLALPNKCIMSFEFTSGAVSWLGLVKLENIGRAGQSEYVFQLAQHQDFTVFLSAQPNSAYVE